MSNNFESRLREVAARDGRYAVGAYKFLYEGLDFTLKSIGCKRHITGQELACGLRDLALEHFGGMASMVFTVWGLQRTADFGNMVYNLIEAELMSRADTDSREDFNDVYDFRETFRLDAVPRGGRPPDGPEIV